jgi:phospholipid/cholesterol/gamma-HCH transport system ATP-binding protein
MSARIRVENLEVVLGGRPVLRGIDLEVPPGEILAVLGISGSGKTTLLRCLAGLLRPKGGRIHVGDVDLTALDESALNEQRRRIGMVFQYAALFDSLPVYENVVFGLKYHTREPEARLREIAREQLAAVGMEGSEALMPAELSGGMRKRVGIARALAGGPDVVLYDEPTSGLDPIVARLIDDLMVSVRDRFSVTSVMVSHDVESVLRISDRVAVLHDGRILACDTPAAIRASGDPAVRQLVEGRTEGPIRVAG